MKEDFEEAMQVQFWAPYHVTMAALPYLKRNSESRIVNISSIGGELPCLTWRLTARANSRLRVFPMRFARKSLRKASV